MVSYTQNELLSITDFTKSISKVLGNLKSEIVEKVGVLKNNIHLNGFRKAYVAKTNVIIVPFKNSL